MHEVHVTDKQAGPKGEGEGEMGWREWQEWKGGERERGAEREREGRQREKETHTETEKLNLETLILKDNISSIRSILDLSNYS